ncbi:ATP-binding cassette domain-containing protein [Pseudofrankia sp. BMG5.36]|uniref:ATP-binding cassette domain-containing protein n=1 Tax=Pseudofrankia sp. BMG5.36 TaxID=1834512 RepID=UPI0008D9529F|nr:ATP-binding cassette domain-containing protein [Pseudofrankia sp. BMG5.36]OHV45581.1 ABC transporter [Pseudofrankia sp. BMG5.36]
MSNVLAAKGLRKSFPGRGGPVEAVRGVDLRVRAGEVFGFLGPNGAGKTTTLRMLATLLPIDAGSAHIAGVDVRRDPAEVRRRIGYVGQVGGADLPATGRENLLLQGRLHGASRAAAARRADELVDVLALGEFVDRRAATYSGGQRRRLEVALGLMHSPALLFLDEPTTGLDPQNRANLWDQLRALRARGTTIFLTTHYLEEADALADRLAIIDRGRVVAEGTPAELKRQVGGETVLLRPGPGPTTPDRLRTLLDEQPFVRESRLAGDTLYLTIGDGSRTLPRLLAALAEHQVTLETISLSAPSLDDVFLRTTGRALRDAGTSLAVPAARQEVPA